MSCIFVLGVCISCKRPITFHPHHVPSLVIDGQREPLCRDCFERWKELHNQPNWPLHPDAYASCETEEL